MVRVVLKIGLSLVVLERRTVAERCLGRSREVHCFYYLWYGSPETDGRYTHWDHKVLPHWNAKTRERYKASENLRYDPPNWLHSPFYPKLGPYSSRDEKVLDTHFAWMAEYGIDAAVLSWTGRDVVSDTQGVRTDDAFPSALKAAAKHNVKVAVHLEPYEGRTPYTVKGDLRYLLDTYGDHLKRFDDCGSGEVIKKKAMVYVYDAYHNSAADWAKILCHDSPDSIRGELDVVVVATVLERRELSDLIDKGCFDGLYTYFATDGFTFGSTSKNWPDIAKYGRSRSKLVSLSVGPGYNDTRIRPWNAAATRDRSNGDYFRRQLSAAFSADPDVVSVTSFNEWGEGTQIEPAQLDTTSPTPHNRTAQFLRATHLAYSDDFLYLKILSDAKRSRWGVVDSSKSPLRDEH